jgi:hypothetical protein
MTRFNRISHYAEEVVSSGIERVLGKTGMNF